MGRPPADRIDFGMPPADHRSSCSSAVGSPRGTGSGCSPGRSERHSEVEEGMRRTWR